MVNANSKCERKRRDWRLVTRKVRVARESSKSRFFL